MSDIGKTEGYNIVESTEPPQGNAFAQKVRAVREKKEPSVTYGGTTSSTSSSESRLSPAAQRSREAKARPTGETFTVLPPAMEPVLSQVARRVQEAKADPIETTYTILPSEQNPTSPLVRGAEAGQLPAVDRTKMDPLRGAWETRPTAKKSSGKV